MAVFRKIPSGMRRGECDELRSKIDRRHHAGVTGGLTGARTYRHNREKRDPAKAATPPGKLHHVPRYLNALRRRLAAATENPSRDATLAWQVREVEDEWLSSGSPDEVRWMIEEFRVSLFAQQLGTEGTISAQRIRKALAAATTPSR